MAQTYVLLKANIASRLQDSAMVVYPTAELTLVMDDVLREIAEYVPYIFPVSFFLESRTGTASSTSSGYLVDTGKSQFLDTDDNNSKVIYNTNDHTWAVVTAYTSASQITLSKDIMASGESYKMFNDGCRHQNEINIGDIIDYMYVDGIERVEFPIGTPRNFEVNDNILRVDLEEGIIGDSSLTTTDKEVLVYFYKRHKVSQLTDLAGALTAGYAAGIKTVNVGSLSGTETIEVDQQFTIAGLRGIYTLTAATTLSGGAGDITFYPGLESAVLTTTVVTFKLSTLKPILEPIFCQLAAGQARINKADKLLLNANTAITTIATATAAVTQINAIIGRAVSDIQLGRTAVTNISALITSADTEIDKIGAQVTLAIADVALARTAVTKIDSLITSADAEIRKVDVQINLAIADLLASRTLDPSIIQQANGILDYIHLSQGDLSTARAYIEKSNALLAEGRADEALVTINRMVASGSLANAGEYIAEANAFFAEARSHEDLASANIRLASGELSTAATRLNEAQGSFQKAGLELRIASGARELVSQGERQVADARDQLRRMQKPKVGRSYSRC